MTTVTKKSAAPALVTLASIAKSLSWDPKTVRQYARRNRASFPKPSGKGWRYTQAQVPAVKKAITDGVA